MKWDALVKITLFIMGGLALLIILVNIVHRRSLRSMTPDERQKGDDDIRKDARNW